MKNPLFFQRLKSCFKFSDSSSSSNMVSKDSLHSTSTSPSTSSITTPSTPAPLSLPPQPLTSSSQNQHHDSSNPHPSSHHTTLPPQNGISFTTPELQALQHWSLYGQPGYNAADPGPEERVVRGDWKTKEWERAVRGVWVVETLDEDGEGDAVGDVQGKGDGAAFTPLRIRGDVLRVLERGFKPREMEDKWFVYCESTDLPQANAERDLDSERGRDSQRDGDSEQIDGARTKNAENKERVLIQEDSQHEDDTKQPKRSRRRATNPQPRR